MIYIQKYQKNASKNPLKSGLQRNEILPRMQGGKNCLCGWRIEVSLNYCNSSIQTGIGARFI